jgi:hypothetical protein
MNQIVETGDLLKQISFIGRWYAFKNAALDSSAGASFSSSTKYK